MSVPQYRCVLFDLDHTLWDYHTNSKETLAELFIKHDLHQKGISSFEDFHASFIKINTALWDSYDAGKIEREVIRFERFHKILLDLGVDEYNFSLQLSDDYVCESPKKGRLLPFASEILEYLSKKYFLLIITNGFNEIQSTKLTSAGIAGYFKGVITSERAGHKKPAREIFEFALHEYDLETHETIMIGDNLTTDIAGARNAGIDTVYFNPDKINHSEQVTHEIQDLRQLHEIL